jgi:predicted flap endonuclease-1-like 5' DNA nuclease
MRTDYVLYAVAVILFIITAIVAASSMDFKQLWIVGTAVLGLFFAALGFSQKPRLSASIPEAPAPAQAPTPVRPTVAEVKVPKMEEAPAIVETPKPTLEVTQVKGVKAKRAEQLKALGINTVEELANASAEDLAKKLKISSKFTEQWIQSAKELTAKP